MSLSVQSPFLGQKRLLSDREDSPEVSTTSSSKRLRRFTASPTGRCARREPGICRAASHLSTLRTLFPHMDEKVVVEVLDSCGNNIDEAIKLLGALQLSKANGTEAQLSEAREGRAVNNAAEPSQLDSAAQGRRPRASDAETQDKIPQKAPAEWVEGLVQQMGDARDLGEARVRAANELRSFEQAVMQTTNKARQDEITVLQARVIELGRENALLKRAVTIQQSRLQEGDAASKEQASQAEAVIAELQGKVHALEMSNYSLSLHLRQATATQNYTTSHPDVF